MASVGRRLPALMRLYPQIDPWNVWELPLSLWWVFAEMTDEFVAKSREADRG